MRRLGYEVRVGGESDKSFVTLTAGVSKQEALVLLRPHFPAGTLTEKDLKSVQAVESACAPLPAGSSPFALLSHSWLVFVLVMLLFPCCLASPPLNSE